MTVALQSPPVSHRLEAARTAFRTLLVHVQSANPMTPRLESAVHLARKLGSTLYGVGAEMMDPIVFSGGFGVGGGVAPELQDAIRDGLVRAEDAFSKATVDLKTIWCATQDQPDLALAQAARAVDLIIAGGERMTDRSTFRHCDTAQLALKSGRPVLVVPNTGGQLKAEAIVVAWKDSREARRALADSLPFLRSAYDVLVLEVCEEDNACEGQAHTLAVVDALKRHGVSARAQVATSPSSRVVQKIEDAASSIGADLIVAGCYGRTRVGEWIFGGVTRDLLYDPRHFLLLSH